MLAVALTVAPVAAALAAGPGSAQEESGPLGWIGGLFSGATSSDQSGPRAPAQAGQGATPAASTPAANKPDNTPVTGTITSRTPVAAAAPRKQRSFNRCFQEAQKRRVRGAERRHFMVSCRLGYGHRLSPAGARGTTPPT